MPLIIDTYNVLHTVGVLPPELAGIDVQGLAEMLKQSRYRAERITLVCDGKPTAATKRNASILIRFSGPGKPADDLIGQLVHASTAPRRLVVVSSDHAVQRTARKRRCRVLTSEEFLTQLADDANLPAAAPTPTSNIRSSDMTDEQVERWVRIFNLENAAAELASLAPSEEPKKPTSEQPLKQGGSSEQKSSEPGTIPDIPPGPVLPASLIEQAEQIWRQSQQQRSTE